MDPKEACTKSNCIFEIKIDLTLIGNGNNVILTSKLFLKNVIIYENCNNLKCHSHDLGSADPEP